MKAGSVWISDVLSELFRPMVMPRVGPDVLLSPTYLERPEHADARIYPGLFMKREEVLALALFRDAQRFIVIRDLRDTIVSLYFSVKFSHPENEDVQRERPKLASMTDEEGLLYFIEGRMRRIAQLQLSWIGHEEIVLRYEDLMADSFGELQRLVEKLSLPVTKRRLRRAVESHSFQARYKRKPGTVDVTSHGRQGCPGDWRRHFTPAVAEAFHAKYGQNLLATGCETDDDWLATHKKTWGTCGSTSSRVGTHHQSSSPAHHSRGT